MAHRTLREAVRCYRIGDKGGAYPIFSGDGAKLYPGRWNDVGQAMIYASQRYSTALLELLVYLTTPPPNQHFIEIEAPRGISYEELNEARVPGWYEANKMKARAFGAQWFDECRSCLLFAPSVVARIDMNILINPAHPDFRLLKVSREKPIWWDERLFGKT